MKQYNKQSRFCHPVLWSLILGLTLISGCFDTEDIDRRMIVSPIGIDADSGGKMLVTFRMPLVNQARQQQGNQTDQKNFILRSASAQGLFPALIDIQNRDVNTIFVGQCRTVIFGEDLAKRGLKPALDFFTRMPTFPPSAFIAIARPTALELLKIDWPQQETNGQNIRWFFSNRANQIFGVKQWELFRNIFDPLQDPLVPIITLSDENTTIKLLGMAVFQGERMVGELDRDETTLFGMLRYVKKENRLVIPIDRSVPITFQVATGKKKLKVSYPGHPLFKLDLKVNAFIGELGGYQSPLSKRELRQLEIKSSRHLERKYLELFRKLQALQSDPLDLGNHFRIQQPKHFLLTKWPQEYRRSEFQVRVKVFIERLGVLQ